MPVARRVATAEFKCVVPTLTALLGATLKSVPNEASRSLLDIATGGRRSCMDAGCIAYLFAKTIPRALMAEEVPERDKKKRENTKRDAKTMKQQDELDFELFDLVKNETPVSVVE